MKTALTIAALAAAGLWTGACIVLPPSIHDRIPSEAGDGGKDGTGGTGGDEAVGGMAPTSALPPCNAGASDGCARVEALALGTWHSCALVDDGHVWCWGSNLHGQLGNPELDRVSHLPPNRVAGLERVSTIEATQDTTCAVAEGDVYCWGKNDLGQFGNGISDEAELQRVALPSNATARELSGTSDTFCAIVEIEDRHTVYCWGRLLNGQLWNEREHSATPEAVSGFSDAPRLGAIATGTYMGCVVTEDGMEVRCWGGNAVTSIGNGDYGTSHVAQPVSAADLVTPVTSISHRTFPCTTSGSTLQCWGNLQEFEPGQSVSVPTTIPGVDGSVLSQAQGWKHQCFLRADGVVDCRGYNLHYELGPPLSDTLEPGPVVIVEGGAVHLAAGWHHNCVISDDGGVACWGNNMRGQCTSNPAPYAYEPEPVTFPR